MTTITVGDDVISAARAVTDLETDTEIAEEALQAFALHMKTQREALKYCGKLHWDPEFAGFDERGRPL